MAIKSLRIETAASYFQEMGVDAKDVMGEGRMFFWCFRFWFSWFDWLMDGTQLLPLTAMPSFSLGLTDDTASLSFLVSDNCPRVVFGVFCGVSFLSASTAF